MMNVLRDILPLLHEQVSLCAATAQLPIFSPLVTWVDDLAIPVPAIRAQELDAQIVAVLTCVKQVMASYGLQLNMRPAKRSWYANIMEQMQLHVAINGSLNALDGLNFLMAAFFMLLVSISI
jgi:hypothetical protein